MCDRFTEKCGEEIFWQDAGFLNFRVYFVDCGL